jgi:hypothetical protein
MKLKKKYQLKKQKKKLELAYQTRNLYNETTVTS